MNPTDANEFKKQLCRLYNGISRGLFGFGAAALLIYFYMKMKMKIGQ